MPTICLAPNSFRSSHSSPLHRNILLYRLLLIFGANGLMTSVIYFFFTSIKGLTPAQALFLVGLSALAKALSEVPTGVVADKFSRKYSIFIGYIVLLVSSVGILVISGFWPLLSLIFLGGMGRSFISGADNALLYDTLKELQMADEFKPISSLSDSIELVAFALTVLVGGILGSINLFIPFVTHIVLLGSSVFISYLLTEPHITATGEKIKQTGYLLHAKQSIATIFSISGLKSGLLGSFVTLALILAVFKSTKNILSPVLDQYGLTISAIGLITALIILIKSVGAFIASKVSNKGSEIKEVAISLFICILGLLAITIIHIPIGQLFIFVIIIGLDNVILINLKTIVNHKIESHHRSTILSLLSLFARSTEMIYLTTFGWMVGAYPFNVALLFTVVWLACCLLVFAFLSKPNVKLS